MFTSLALLYIIIIIYYNDERYRQMLVILYELMGGYYELAYQVSQF